MKNKQTGLQGLLKILGIIALVAVIVFSTAACDGIFGGGGGGNNSGNSAGNGNGGGGDGNGGGGSDDIMSLPSMKEQFSEYFMMGNIFNPNDAPTASAITNTKLTLHFNVLTAENNMKPSYISNGPSSYNFTIADRMVNAARASHFQVVGHTLLWHSQNAGWMTSSSCTLANMKTYVTGVVTHFRGKIYSWDVLNEVFPDGVSASADWKNVMRQENPWYKAIGSTFVYEGFLAARLADPDAILYYNDYNMDNVGKATMVRDMVRDVNAQYKEAYPAETRLLIEGIGMQSHHNTNVTAAQIKASLELFKHLKVKISISELDVLGQSYQQFAAVGQGTNKHNSSTVTAAGLETQARLYGEYMKVFLEYSDIIERVSLWGVTDDQSWRSAGKPLLFDAQGKAKASYHSFVGALK
jgi:endo-1,4-beta-xylanase